MGQPVANQLQFQGRDDDVTLNSLTFNGGGGLNTGWTQDVDTVFRIRFEIGETAGGNFNNKVYTLWYSYEGGTFEQVTQTSAEVQIENSGQYTDQDATTEVLGSGADMVAGVGIEDPGTASPQISLNGSETEVEFCLTIISGAVADAESLEFQVRANDTLLTTYSNEPWQVTINEAAPDPANPVIPVITTVGARVAAYALIAATTIGVGVPQFFPFVAQPAPPVPAAPVIPYIQAAQVMGDQVPPLPIAAAPRFFPLVLPPAGRVEQTAFRGRNRQGASTLNVTNFEYALNTDWLQIEDAFARLRIRWLLTNTGDADATREYAVFVSKNSGVYRRSSIADVRLAGTSEFSQNDPTTQLLGSGVFVTGRGVTSGINASDPITLAVGEETEVEGAFQLLSGADPGDTYDVRLYQSLDGTLSNSVPLASYTQTPRITITHAPHIPFRVGRVMGDKEPPLEAVPQFSPIVRSAVAAAPANPVIPFRVGRVMGDEVPPLPIGAEPRFYPLTESTAILEQTLYRFRNDDGDEETATWRQATNVPDEIGYDQTVRLRIAVEEVGGGERFAGPSPEWRILRFLERVNGGSFAVIDGSSTDIQVVPSQLQELLNTTQQITSGDFITLNGGQDDVDGIVGSANNVFTANIAGEYETSFQVLSSGTYVEGDVVELKLIAVAGDLDLYTVFATFTVRPASPAIPFIQAAQVMGDAVPPVVAFPQFSPIVRSPVAAATANPVIPFQTVRDFGDEVPPMHPAVPRFSPLVSRPAAFDQTQFRFRNDDGTEVTATWRRPVNFDDDNPGIDLDTTYRVRFTIEEINGIARDSVFFRFQYSVNSGTWNNLLTFTGAIRVVDSQLVNNDDTTQQISSGDFVTPNAGQNEDGIVNVIAANDFAGNDKGEYEVGFQALSAQGITAGDTVDFRMKFGPGSEVLLDQYTVAFGRAIVKQWPIIPFRVTTASDLSLPPTPLAAVPQFLPVILPNFVTHPNIPIRKGQWIGDAPPPMEPGPRFFPTVMPSTEVDPANPVIPFNAIIWKHPVPPHQIAPQFLPVVLPNFVTHPNIAFQVFRDKEPLHPPHHGAVNLNYFYFPFIDFTFETHPNIPIQVVRDFGDRTPPLPIAAKPKYFPFIDFPFETSPVPPFRVGRDFGDKAPPIEAFPKFYPFIDFTFETHPNIQFRVMPPTATVPDLGAALPKFYPTLMPSGLVAAANPVILFKVVPPTATVPKLGEATPQFLPVILPNFVTHPNIPIIYGRSLAEQDPAVERYPFQRPVFLGFPVGNAPPIVYDPDGYGTCILQIDPTLYPAAAAFYMEAVIKSDIGTAAARLFNITDAVAVAGSEVTTLTTSFVRLRSGALTLPAGPREYRVEPGLSAGSVTTVCGARVIVST